MARLPHVPADVVPAAARALLGDREAVELVAVNATYAMVPRFLVALGVEPEERTGSR